MKGGVLLVLALCFFSMLVWVRLWLAANDRRRVKEHIVGLGGAVENIRRTLSGIRGVRSYRVIYTDAQGMRHQATCLTSRWKGVFVRDDGASEPQPLRAFPVIDVSEDSGEIALLRGENQRLRQELDELKRRTA